MRLSTPQSHFRAPPQSRGAGGRCPALGASQPRAGGAGRAGASSALRGGSRARVSTVSVSRHAGGVQARPLDPAPDLYASNIYIYELCE